ncbi:hypothetical protein [Desulforhabdus amnigena]|uniref:Nucleotidyltransferase family protein n=1 Tax=Desulforhabdus amnigena TaxID=40218 RepID=A0A9W6FU66_9BACT|nr:hypothetical protein [Desulforhabdus amnigena]NLJ27412.1 nucleotidyltransferase family protein [Deltaproteobacteria bacterium]GLI34937.1 hypothetical protein DAMNIGENAA_23700 [Desulforhabdus amnigena]
MNLYDEFFSMISMLNKLGIRYAVVGGIALAFHGRPRFTRGVDFLVHHKDMDLLKTALERLGYEETAEPWMLTNTTLILHRFLKVEGHDELMIDILLASDDEHLRVIQDAVVAESEVGQVPVAARRDIIWMKRSRNSDQDRVDISELEENDENRESS